jgi:2-oxoglutarate dehydrogenase E2 component (dihydrolipoamide succinyltransferase)
MIKVLVPNVNNNETEAVLNEWLVEDDFEIEKGDLIATLETTKAEIDLEAEASGKIKIFGTPGQSYSFGSLIGWIYFNDDDLETMNSQMEVVSEKKAYKITAPAQKFIEDNNIEEAEVEKLGIKIVKIKDVEHLIKSNNDQFMEIDLKQQTVANTVINSKTNIPDAFNLKKVYLDNAHKHILEYSNSHNFKIGIPEILIFIISRLFHEHPVFFGKIIDAKSILKSKSCNIGVTLDLGKGLFIPVITSSEELSLDEISQQLMSFKMKALRNSFKSDDFADPSITISLNMDTDTVYVQPIIFPGQACMISVSSVFKEIKKEENELVEKRFFNLGLAYDHRIINGFEANQFLTDTKKYLEDEESVY